MIFLHSIVDLICAIYKMYMLFIMHAMIGFF